MFRPDFLDCGGGGAVLVASDVAAFVTVSNSTFTGNWAYSGGALALLASSAPGSVFPVFQLEVTGCHFRDNIAGPGDLGMARLSEFSWSG